MAELVDALASGASVSNDVEVQVLSRAPNKKETMRLFFVWYNFGDILSGPRTCKGRTIRLEDGEVKTAHVCRVEILGFVRHDGCGPYHRSTQANASVIVVMSRTV